MILREYFVGCCNHQFLLLAFNCVTWARNTDWQSYRKITIMIYLVTMLNSDVMFHWQTSQLFFLLRYIHFLFLTPPFLSVVISWFFFFFWFFFVKKITCLVECRAPTDFLVFISWGLGLCFMLVLFCVDVPISPRGISKASNKMSSRRSNHWLLGISSLEEHGWFAWCTQMKDCTLTS